MNAEDAEDLARYEDMKRDFRKQPTSELQALVDTVYGLRNSPPMKSARVALDLILHAATEVLAEAKAS